jgi:uncharacterized protein (TIGR02001 family)
VRLLAGGMAVSCALLIGMPRCWGADLWGGSLGVTSDYVVRGITRSNDQAALQLDLHYLNASGFTAGLFASNTQIDPYDPRDAELNAFVGFAWSAGSDWRGKALLSHYAYPWNMERHAYDYDELDVEWVFRDWLNLAAVYSPDEPRYLPARGLVGVTSTAAEVGVQRPVLRSLSATAGVGYSRFDGQSPQGYAYWSVGAAYDLAPVSLSLSYVNTSAGAKALFYNAAVRNGWVGTVIWRF